MNAKTALTLKAHTCTDKELAHIPVIHTYRKTTDFKHNVRWRGATVAFGHIHAGEAVTWESHWNRAYIEAAHHAKEICSRLAVQTAEGSLPNLLSMWSGSHTGSVTVSGLRGKRILAIFLCSFIVIFISLSVLIFPPPYMDLSPHRTELDKTDENSARFIPPKSFNDFLIMVYHLHSRNGSLRKETSPQKITVHNI